MGFIHTEMKKGSYFVQCLVEVFRERVAHDDLDTMLIEVNRRLSQMQGSVLRKEGVKQVNLTCEFINRLTKKTLFSVIEYTRQEIIFY